MTVRLDPAVLDLVREKCDLTSDEKVGSKLGVTGHTVRQWRNGNTRPAVEYLVKMQFLTGRPYGTMLIISDKEAA